MVVLLPILLYHHVLVDRILISLYCGLKLTLECKWSGAVLVVIRVQKVVEYLKPLDIVEETLSMELCGLKQMQWLVILVT